MSAHHYNTTHLTGEDLEKAIQAAVRQEDKVMALFNSTPGNEYTPCQVHELIRSSGPLTSTRRAMSNLTKNGKLIKTTNQKDGIYGKLNYTWVLPGYVNNSKSLENQNLRSAS